MPTRPGLNQAVQRFWGTTDRRSLSMLPTRMPSFSILRRRWGFVPTRCCAKS